ncbi:MAG: 3-dehydroquinate synthase [Balneola sp.]|nr:MAG: 3-dehydroquinate synthase [Balneola sp.]
MSEVISVSTNSVDTYEIKIGKNLIKEASEFISAKFSSQKIFVIIDEKAYSNHSEYIDIGLSKDFERVIKYVVPSGETNKSLDQFSSVAHFVLQSGVERNTALLAIGGGVVGDLAGFVAASVLRGIPLIHMPTTLLAMVDSSIGGKTGINHTVGKNLLGAFYQPKAVFADIRFLKSLPKKEWVNGLSEILKYGMIEAPDIFEQLTLLTKNGKFASPKEWIPIISQSAQIKADIVSKDVKESGIREALNFGHTFAHVIENVGNYEKYSHGEAVFAGMFGAVSVSNAIGASIGLANLEQFKPLYDFNLSELSSTGKELTQLMLNDKKVKDNIIRLILLQELGDPFVKPFSETLLIEESWNALISEFS